MIPECRSIEGAPGRYFDCPYGMGLLSDKACGNSHLLSITAESIAIGRRSKCRHCPIGMCHAGIELKKASVSVFFGRVICPRCHRGATRLATGLCHSCYNGQREVRIGVNSRGTVPRKLKLINNVNLLFICADGIVIEKFNRVTSITEAVLRRGRLVEEPVRFGWVGAGIINGGDND